MGFDVNGVRFLLAARSAGVNFETTAMIGRQRMHLFPQALEGLLENSGYIDAARNAEAIIREADGFAEPFLNVLGAVSISSFDASTYEYATDIHDMNEPIPGEYLERYSVVIDGGSLEHVFNFPNAIKNCMNMVETGGHYLGITPANNFMGHGFYQFSPELYFRVFSEANGFRIDHVTIFEDVPGAQWVQLTDPDILGKRVEMVNSKPAYLLVQAIKTANKPVFATAPQQSDYSAAWKKTREISD